MRILVLDDDMERHQAFSKNLAGHEVVHALTYDSCLRSLLNDKPYDVVYLDHDLNDFGQMSVGPSEMMYGSGVREYDGRDVANFIARHLPKTQYPKAIVVHSWNDTGGDSMMATLKTTGIPLRREEFHRDIGR